MPLHLNDLPPEFRRKVLAEAGETVPAAERKAARREKGLDVRCCTCDETLPGTLGGDNLSRHGATHDGAVRFEVVIP